MDRAVLTLLANGETGAALGLFLWGALVVSWIDNLIRPLVISGPTRIPFLLVFLGVLGGLHAFGLIGLFLGPVLLAVSVASGANGWGTRVRIEVEVSLPVTRW